MLTTPLERDRGAEPLELLDMFALGLRDFIAEGRPIEDAVRAVALRAGGVRYEDLLLVTETGCETLTDYDYDLTPRS